MSSSETQMQSIAILAKLDAELDEIRQELGDLPDKVKAIEEEVRQRNEAVEEVKQQLDQLLDSRSKAAIALQELHDKEEKYAEQQFNVRNNREFDAITQEMETIKIERSRINNEQRTTNVTEENLRSLMEERQQALSEAQSDLEVKERELNEHSKEHGAHLKELTAERRVVMDSLSSNAQDEYERIRTFHAEPAASVRRNSCSGCYNKVPPQKVVEIRTYQDKLYYCEHCGRILFVPPSELI